MPASLYEKHKAIILDVLNSTDKELSTKQIGQRVAMNMTRVWKMVHWMRDENVIHLRRQIGGMLYYRPGPGTHAQRPETTQLILSALTEHGPMTADAIAEKIGMARSHVAAWIKKRMRGLQPGQGKLVFVKKHIKTGPTKTARALLFDVGNMPDAKPPMPQTLKVSNARKRARLKADSVKYAFHRAKARRHSIKPKADPVIASVTDMIFGRAPLTPETIAACEAQAEQDIAERETA